MHHCTIFIVSPATPLSTFRYKGNHANLHCVASDTLKYHQVQGSHANFHCVPSDTLRSATTCSASVLCCVSVVPSTRKYIETVLTDRQPREIKLPEEILFVFFYYLYLCLDCCNKCFKFSSTLPEELISPLSIEPAHQ